MNEGSENEEEKINDFTQSMIIFFSCLRAWQSDDVNAWESNNICATCTGYF